MPHKPKPTTTPALIDQAKSCTSTKDVIRTLFGITRTPNGLDRKEAKKIFAKEGIPWPSARGRKRKGEFVVKKPHKESRAERIAREIRAMGNDKPEETPDRPDPTPRSPIAFCPACGTGIYECIDRPCEGCKRDLTIEIHARTIFSITAK